MSAIDFGFATDTGRVRDHNEDSVGVFPDLGLFIVADGMGGHQGGEVASALVVAAIAEEVRSGGTLADAVGRAHQVVLAAGREGRGTPGMGATVVALHVAKNAYEIAWVGDSRAYRWDGRLQLLTRDHSYVQRMIDAGALTDGEAREHPDRSVITQALGAEGMDAVEVEVVAGRLIPGLKILLCSDGLTSMVDDETMAALLVEPDTDQAMTDRLVQAANAAGGEDNVSVVIVSALSNGTERIENSATRPMRSIQPEENAKVAKRKPRLLWMLVVVVILAVAGCLAAWWAFKPQDTTMDSPSGQLSSPLLKQADGQDAQGQQGTMAMDQVDAESSVLTIETADGPDGQNAIQEDDAAVTTGEMTPPLKPVPDIQESDTAGSLDTPATAGDAAIPSKDEP